MHQKPSSLQVTPLAGPPTLTLPSRPPTSTLPSRPSRSTLPSTQQSHPLLSFLRMSLSNPTLASTLSCPCLHPMIRTCMFLLLRHLNVRKMIVILFFLKQKQKSLPGVYKFWRKHKHVRIGKYWLCKLVYYAACLVRRKCSKPQWSIPIHGERMLSLLVHPFGVNNLHYLCTHAVCWMLHRPRYCLSINRHHPLLLARRYLDLWQQNHLLHVHPFGVNYLHICTHAVCWMLPSLHRPRHRLSISCHQPLHLASRYLDLWQQNQLLPRILSKVDVLAGESSRSLAFSGLASEKKVSAAFCSCCTPFCILKRMKTALFTPRLESRTRGVNRESITNGTGMERNGNGTVTVREHSFAGTLALSDDRPT